MLIMQNLCDVVGRAFGGTGFVLIAAAGAVAMIFALVSGTVFVPQLVAALLPFEVGRILLPALIAVFYLAGGALVTGLFLEGQAAAQRNVVPASTTTTMAFYGQMGMVFGNILIFLILF